MRNGLVARNADFAPDHKPDTPDRHRSHDSSAVERSVRSSRYFTITGVWSDKPSSFPQPVVTARAPGTTTAPAGNSSGASADPRITVSWTRSKTGVPRDKNVPPARTALALPPEAASTRQ